VKWEQKIFRFAEEFYFLLALYNSVETDAPAATHLTNLKPYLAMFQFILAVVTFFPCALHGSLQTASHDYSLMHYTKLVREEIFTCTLKKATNANLTPCLLYLSGCIFLCIIHHLSRNIRGVTTLYTTPGTRHVL
jgi:hypothetical protein